MFVLFLACASNLKFKAHILSLELIYIGIMFIVILQASFQVVFTHDQWIKRVYPWEWYTNIPWKHFSLLCEPWNSMKFIKWLLSLFQSIKDVDLQALSSLEYLDLSRNLIREIMPGTFLGMANLKGLDFSVNVVRKVSYIFKFKHSSWLK